MIEKKTSEMSSISPHSLNFAVQNTEAQLTILHNSEDLNQSKFS